MLGIIRRARWCQVNNMLIPMMNVSLWVLVLEFVSVALAVSAVADVEAVAVARDVPVVSDVEGAEDVLVVADVEDAAAVADALEHQKNKRFWRISAKNAGVLFYVNFSHS